MTLLHLVIDKDTTVVQSVAQLQGLDKPLFIIDDPVPIIDGHITFFDRKLDCFFQIRVRQTKGRGAYYADQILEPNEDHKEIMKMLKMLNQDQEYTTQQFIDQLRLYRSVHEDKRQVKYKPFGARISELLRKNVIILEKNGKYHINFSYIDKVLKAGKF